MRRSVGEGGRGGVRMAENLLKIKRYVQTLYKLMLNKRLHFVQLNTKQT